MIITAAHHALSIFFGIVTVAIHGLLCGINALTLSASPAVLASWWASFSLHMRRNSLDTPRLSSGQPSHQLGQRPQILSAEMRSARRGHHDRIGGDHVCPTGRKADQIPVVSVAVDTVFPPVVLVEEQLELAPDPGMVGMDDAKTSSRYVVLGCSR
jgi:hypothetical protein